MRYSYSVIVPTFKNNDMLLRTVESLRNQTTHDFEVVVINNFKEDGLKEKLANYSSENPALELVYINYPLDGAYGARSVGMTYSKGDVIISVDDDETCHPNFVQSYIDFFEAHDEVVLAGGPYILRFDTPAPAWVTEYLAGKKIDYVWGNFELFEETKIDEAVNVWGGNMAMRRSVFSYTGWYPGKNNGLSFGPHESGMVLDVANKKGQLMAYLPHAIVYHHMPASRLTVKHVRWSASYMITMRVFYRYTKRKITFFNLVGDYFKTIFEYYKLWIKDILFAKGKTDPKSLDTQYLASMGYIKMKYLTWILTNKGNIREFIKKYATGFSKYEIIETAVKIDRFSKN